jgi:hypothetical protein
LPCPVEEITPTAKRFLDIVDFADEINNDTLIITGLTDKTYEITIDGISLGIFTSFELSTGVNLSKPMKGPLWDQAVLVAQATQERQRAHYAKWRTVWLKPDDSSSGQYDFSNQHRIKKLDAQAQAAIKKQHQVNTPVWTTFTLTPVPASPVIFPKPVTYTSCGKRMKDPPLEPLDWSGKNIKMIDLRSVVNRAFADEVANDGQGGWSDQGPMNDLSPFPIGRQTLNGVPFDIIEPEKNAYKSMLVLSRRPGPKVPDHMTVPIGTHARVLTFLHTGAWMDLLSRVAITICYPGGIRKNFTFTPGIHLCDWMQVPFNYPAAVPAWSGRNGIGDIYVTYAPVFNPLPDVPIEAIEISIPETSECIYGLIAITALI